MIRLVKFSVLVFVLVFMAGCNGCNENKSREKPDVSAIKIDTKILRFDQDLKNARQTDFIHWKQGMQNKYRGFYNFYLGNFIIGPRPQGDTADIEREAIGRFLQDQYIRTIQDSIDTRFANTKDVEQDLENMFRYFKHYYPAFEAPEVVGINSAYGAGVSPFGRDQLVVGLDMFLGADNHDYDSIGVYSYLRHKMKREYIARYAAEAMFDEYFPAMGANPNANLIEAIIERGKKLYFISYLFPDAPDSLILGYTQAQAEWCRKSEYSIWQFFNEKDLLYKNNAMDKTRYLGEGPTTSGMPPESPGGVGSYLGLQIVRKFMNETGGKIPLKQLMEDYNAKTILAKANYRPPKPNF